jgi:hypothetical protein
MQRIERKRKKEEIQEHHKRKIEEVFYFNIF